MKEPSDADIPATGLHIQLLGEFAVQVDGSSIPDTQWKSRRARNLVKLLALASSHRLHRDQIIEALWPEADPSAGANSLHQTLYTARRILEPWASGCLTLEEGLLNLSGGNGRALAVDVAQFEAAAAQAQDSQDPLAYQDALRLYTGELLPDDRYEQWTVRRRETLQQEYLQLLLDQARLQESQHNYPAGIESLRSLLAADPCHEEAHAGLMRLYALSGQRQQALRQYQALCEILQSELEAEPGPATRQLYADIQSGQIGEAAPAVLPDLPVRRHNLPAELTSFIGREKEVAAVKQLLARTRLLTLSGVGGTGKTRLALAVANQVLNEFEHGVWLVELASVSDPELIASNVISLFGFSQERNKPLSEILSDYLCDKRMLLILDNCEHLIQEAALFTETLLQAAPEVKVLTTSRESLGLTGETIYLVPSLSTPELPHLPAINTLDQFESVRLFTERAVAVSSTFTLNERNAQAVAQICRQLDGIPLAIELAAARVKVLSPEQIAARLDDRFNLLTGGSRTAYPRHQTLHALIDWSYKLLTGPERILFCQLSIFRGGWTLAAAEAVCQCAHPGDYEVLDLLAGLVNKSLIQTIRGADNSTRYQMLETIRQYAQEQLLETGEARPVRNRQLDYFLAFAERMEKRLHSPTYLETLAQLDNEIDNLRAALGWAFAAYTGQPARAADGLRLANALEVYWDSRYLKQEGYEWLEKGLALIPEEDEGTRPPHARALFLAGYLGQSYVSQVKSQLLFSKSVEVYRQCDDRLGLAKALISLGEMLADLHPNSPHPVDIELGIVRIEEGIALLEELDTVLARGWAFLGKARLAGGQEDWATARTMTEKALVCFEQSEDISMCEQLKGILAIIAMYQEDYTTARRFFEQRLKYALEMDRRDIILVDYPTLGLITYGQKDFTWADFYFQKSRMLYHEYGPYAGVIWVSRMLGSANFHLGRIPLTKQYFLEGQASGRRMPYGDPYGDLAFILWMGVIAESQKKSALAARFLGAVEATLETFFKLLDEPEQIEYDRITGILRGKMDEETFAAAWAEGRELSFDRALEEALSFCRQDQDEFANEE